MFFARLSRLTKTLRFRLTVWNVVVIVLTSVATLIGVRQGVRLALLSEMDQILIEDLYEIEYKLVDIRTTVTDIRRAAQSQSHLTAQRLLDDLDRKARGHERHGWFVQLWDKQNHLLWASENSPDQLRFPNQGVRNFHPWTESGFRVVENHDTTRGFSPLIVRAGASTEFLDRDMAHIDRLVAMVAVIVLLIAPPIGYWLAGRATRPLGNIIRTASRLRPNHMEERLPIRKTHDELDQLAHTINHMLNRIADYLAERRDFLANSTHELRSPLAAIRSTVEVALGSPRTKEEYEDLLVGVIEECSALEVLVNQLLLLAETENVSPRTEGRPVNLSLVVERACDMFQAAAESRGVFLEARIQPELFVEGHQYHLRQVLNNLIDNALKFTPARGTVEVDLQANSDQIFLSVRDTGIGIPAADLPRVFERFFRGDRSHSRNPETRGTGLGLSICQGVIEAHGGKITIASQTGQGTTLAMTLPRSDQTASNQLPLAQPPLNDPTPLLRPGGP